MSVWAGAIRDYVVMLAQTGEALPTIDIETMPCMVCHLRSTITVSTAAAARWFGGELIQVAFPDMSPAEREHLKLGTHPACWDTIFVEDDD